MINVPSLQTVKNQLPPFNGAWSLVKKRQSVSDIMETITSMYYETAADYDLISPLFYNRTVNDTARSLYEFCKQHLRYRAESQKFQSVGGPASILDRAQAGVDCKSYASFIGGVLGSLNRLGYIPQIDWRFVFASYDLNDRTPYHVYVSYINRYGIDCSIDPTPGSELQSPVYVIDETMTDSTKQEGTIGRVPSLVPAKIGALDSSYVLMDPPAWYPSYLPKFYNNNFGWYVYPNAPVKGYTRNDVLDMLLYFQTICGLNIVDHQYSISVATTWAGSTGDKSIEDRVIRALSVGDGGGNWASVPTNGRGENGALYAELQTRYIQNEATAKPWLSAMQGKAGGIDLLTLPFASDEEKPRPTWYPAHLPSLFVSKGARGQYSGKLDTKPKIRNTPNSGYTQIDPDPTDIAYLSLYAQPIILEGPKPWPVNFYYGSGNSDGAVFILYKIATYWPVQTSANAQYGVSPSINLQPYQSTWGYYGDMFFPPEIQNADKSFIDSLVPVVFGILQKYVVSNIPGAGALVTAAQTAGSLTGSQTISDGRNLPVDSLSDKVAIAADAIIQAGVKKQADAQAKKNGLLLLLLGAGIFGYIVLRKGKRGKGRKKVKSKKSKK